MQALWRPAVGRAAFAQNGCVRACRRSDVHAEERRSASCVRTCAPLMTVAEALGSEPERSEAASRRLSVPKAGRTLGHIFKIRKEDDED